MLLEYINKNFKNAEPIFLNELPCKSLESLRQEMKKLTDEGKLIRLYNGVYYKPYKTVLGTEGKISIDKFIEKKYIKTNNELSGYICGISLYNKYGFTTQIPSVIEVTSNEATTKQRKLIIDGYKVIVYKPAVKITNENIKELEFLDLMTYIDKYSELKGDELKRKLKEYVSNANIDFDRIKKYLPLYPDRVYRNIFEGGLMSELV